MRRIILSENQFKKLFETNKIRRWVNKDKKKYSNTKR